MIDVCVQYVGRRTASEDLGPREAAAIAERTFLHPADKEREVMYCTYNEVVSWLEMSG